MDTNSVDIVNKICQTIYAKKGFNILAMDVRNVCSTTDFFVVAEGNIDRHVRALARSLKDELVKDYSLRPLAIEGEKYPEWMVLDYGDIIVHLFVPEFRDKYQIERAWKEGKLIELELEQNTYTERD